MTRAWSPSVFSSPGIWLGSALLLMALLQGMVSFDLDDEMKKLVGRRDRRRLAGSSSPASTSSVPRSIDRIHGVLAVLAYVWGLIEVAWGGQHCLRWPNRVVSASIHHKSSPTKCSHRPQTSFLRRVLFGIGGPTDLYTGLTDRTCTSTFTTIHRHPGGSFARSIDSNSIEWRPRFRASAMRLLSAMGHRGWGQQEEQAKGSWRHGHGSRRGTREKGRRWCTWG